MTEITKKSAKSGLEHFARQNRETISLYAFVLLMAVVATIIAPQFVTRNNITNIFNQITPIGFVALGMTFVILTTGIDLSVGAVMSMTTTIAATIMVPESPLYAFFGVLIVFAASIAIGSINGLLISRLNFEPLIATLAVGTIVNGITLLILPYPGGYVPPVFTNLWLHHVAGFVPLGFAYLLVATAAAHFMLKYTILGRRLYAIGGNEKHSAVAGISVRKVKFSAYIISSLFAALSGLALATRMRSGDPLAGAPFTLTAVAATLVGGTTFSGGVGGVIGTFAGVLIVGILSIVLNIIGVSPYIKDMLTGFIIVIAVIYASYGRK